MNERRPVLPVILSGGFGTRLWPASRRRRPKQLLPLVDDRTLLRATAERVRGDEFLPPVVVCNADHALPIRRELEAAGVPDAELVLEPVARNTAPAVAAAACHVLGRGDDPLLLVLPADHVIADVAAFGEAVALAVPHAGRGHLMTFGARPTRPETGYGYIQVGEPLDGGPVRRIERFVEKPDRETAERFLAEGAYLWNSGMFLFGASRYLEELERFEPEIVAAVRRAVDRGTTVEGVALDPEAFAEAPSTSVDYAVMEHTRSGAVVPFDAGWSDVGSWEALWELGPRDEHDNVLLGDVVALDTKGSYVRSGGRLVATVGLEDAVVVDTADAILVTTRDRAQDVKRLVDELAARRREEVETDGSEERPWGRFTTLARGPGFRVLRLWLVPGGKTSVKSHEHRSEYWIVIRGTARVRVGEVTRLLPPGESVFVPVGQLHRLENPDSRETLEVVEVDVGSYVGEDDIRRFIDAYGRAERRG